MKTNDEYLVEAAEKHMQQFELKGFKNMFKSLHKTFDEAMTKLRQDVLIGLNCKEAHSITVLDFTNGKVIVHDIQPEQDAEEFLIEKGYRINNVQYLVTNKLKLEVNPDVK